jgi:hypothetical protein
MLKKILIALAATIDRRRAAALRVAGGADRDDGQRRRRRSLIKVNDFLERQGGRGEDDAHRAARTNS